MRLLRLLNRLFNRPAWLTFLVMGIAAGGLALCSFNLLALFQANFSPLLTYGAMAALDGGTLQPIELAAWGYLALAFYVVFKDCLDGLLTRIHCAREIARLSIAPHPHLTRRPVPPS
jgi:hypothetical protein